MAYKAPGKHYRNGLSLIELMERFPDEETATQWFEVQVWPDGRCCSKCGATETTVAPDAKPMPYWCPDCRSYFSVRTGTVLSHSKVPLRKWAIAIYLELTSLKGISSMKLHRDIEVTQTTAWFMLHRIREAWAIEWGGADYLGPVEVDETYMGGKRKNMSNTKRKLLADAGRGSAGKTAVVGVKDRASGDVSAQVVQSTDAKTLQGFVAKHTAPGARVYTDEAAAYHGLPYEHEAVSHSVHEYVRDQIHTNGIESFWATLKRAHTGTFHKMSKKHLDRYVRQFAGKHNIRDADTIEQMKFTMACLVGRRLLYRDLIADNGLPSGARS